MSRDAVAIGEHRTVLASPATAVAPDGTDPRRARRVLLVLTAAVTIAIAAFLLLDVAGSWDFALRLRGRRVAALAIVGYAIACSTVLFQTITTNRILTPSIMGFDSLYVLLQTVVVFAFGGVAVAAVDPRLRFLIEASLLVGFAMLLHRWLFGRGQRTLFTLVLIGVVLGTLFSSLSSLAMRLIDPNDFDRLQDRLFASFNAINVDLLVLAGVVVAVCTLFVRRLVRPLDVVALGRDHATSLGVDHHAVVARALVLVAVLVAVSTALVGPITFFGLLVVNLAVQLLGTLRHRYLLPAAALLGVLTLVVGQLLLERVFRFDTSLSIIVNFVGGVYFIGLLLREARR